ncbi:MAG: DUF2207 domain-containing protein [Dehalococcoidia bacterium]
MRPTRSLLPLGATVLALLAALAVTMAPPPARAQAGVEKIDSYHVDLRIEADGDLIITEDIAYDFGSQERHGIFRDVPTRLRYDGEFDRRYPMKVLSVTASAGTPAQYRVEGIEGGKTRIRIGDEDRTITGQHTYRIEYRIEGGLNGFTDHDELYWNAIGADWSATIFNPSVTVHLPAALAPDEVQVGCFEGPRGSSLRCASATIDGAQVDFTNGELSPYEGLTVVVGFPKGMVPDPQPILERRWTFQHAFTVDPLRIGLALGLLAVVLAGIVRLVWLVGRDRRWRGSPVEVVFGGTSQQRVPLFEGGAYAIEFTPPEDLRPGQIGTLLDEVAHPLDVSATIVDLAARGYLRIEEIDKTWWFGKSDWRFVRLPDPPADRRGLLPYESTLRNSLFEDGDEVTLSSLKRKFHTDLARVQEQLYADAVSRGWFNRRPDSTRGRWLAISIGALVVSGAIIAATAAWTTFGIVPIPLALGSLSLLALHSRMPRRTAKGTAALRRVLGFRQYIETAETRRSEFAEKANLFYEYLPFAVVFGSVDKWAEAFADLALEPPDWYSSSRPFNAVMLGNAMSGFSTTTSGTLASTPGGSGGSGFSGGSSGGGGGGGGGGSW